MLLRAVNVGGRKLGMSDLRRLTEAAGGRSVETYLQSGNVVFAGAAAVASALSTALTAELGFEVPVLRRTAKELADVVENNPFDAAGTMLSVTFLEAPPPAGAVATVDPNAFGSDRFVVRGREIYVHTPDGYGRTKLNNAFWERKLGMVATTRNWNTVCALADLTTR